MKSFFTKKRALIGGGLIFLIVFPLYLFIDAFYGSHFRSMQDKVSFSQDVNVTGLQDLRASGGTSVRFLDLKRRLSHIKGPIIIVDGMAEFHGYIYGIPTTFFGYQREGSPNFKQLLRRLIVTGTTSVRPELVTSESVEAKKQGFDYRKVNVGSKFIETDENIDDIVDFYDHLPEGAWLHFHCAHGKGRTSILLVMLDIMKNAPTVPLKDIVNRQYLLGSEDLFDTTVWKNGTYTQKDLEARKNFIEMFYQFICQRKSRGIPLWSDWHKQVKW